jgi:fumarate hydratase subunit beta
MAIKTFNLHLPISRKEIEELKAGDLVYLTGRIFTLRDRSHQRIEEYLKEGKEVPFDLRDGAILHCGPIVKYKKEKEWEAVCIGATSSSRFSPFIPSLIKELGPRVIIGKGNLFKEAEDILKLYSVVFLLAIGGCAALYGSQVKRVVNNYWEEFGMVDSVWELEMDGFGPLSVGIDCKGRNLYEQLRTITLRNNLKKIYEDLDIDPNFDFTWWPKIPAGTAKATKYSTSIDSEILD